MAFISNKYFICKKYGYLMDQSQKYPKLLIGQKISTLLNNKWYTVDIIGKDKVDWYIFLIPEILCNMVDFTKYISCSDYEIKRFTLDTKYLDKKVWWLNFYNYKDDFNNKYQCQTCRK